MFIQGYRRKISYWVIAVLGFLIIWGFTFPKVEKTGKEVYDVVFFGDSVLGLVRDETGIAQLVGKKTGKTVYNAAFGGTCISRINRDNELDNAWDSLSLVAIANGVQTDSFIPQKSANILDSVTEYFAETVDGLEQIDFTQVNTIVIEHGLNDFYANVPLRNEKDPFDEYTFSGALRTTLKTLKEKNPNVRILLVTPTYTWLTPSKQTCEEYGEPETYVEEMISIAEENDVEWIDVYHDYFPHEKWEDWSTYTADGLHPNTEGRMMLADTISEVLRGGNE